MNVPTLSTAEVAKRLQMPTRKVSKTAREIGVGHDYGGRVGFRFTEADAEAILDSFRITAGAK